MRKKIYRGNITSILAELTDINYQKAAWLYPTRQKPKMTISFVEASNMLFDDCVIKDYLEEGEILFDHATTVTLHDLHSAIQAVNEFKPEEEIINDPLMQIVRQKAAKALALIEASDGRESTVEIIE